MSDWLTYAQAGERFGVSAEAVRLRARRLGGTVQNLGVMSAIGPGGAIGQRTGKARCTGP
jgi:hypothetical protein